MALGITRDSNKHLYRLTFPLKLNMLPPHVYPTEGHRNSENNIFYPWHIKNLRRAKVTPNYWNPSSGKCVLLGRMLPIFAISS